jgi:hypothetical protein
MNKYFLLLWIVLLCSCTRSSLPKNQSERENIKKLFHNWQLQEIQNGRYWAIDSCNPHWFSKHNIKETPNDIKFGFPSDSSEYQFSFTDLNNDKKLDCLVVFDPNQCDGGNLMEWKQMQVFIISGKIKYEIIDSLDLSKFAATNFDSSGFYLLDSIAKNKIFGTYIEFKNDDGRCCPSIRRSVTFDYIQRKLISIGKNI